MKINSLHIYGFGKWSNKKIDFSNELNVIYGNNEAGKTTIMSFLHFVLFGFSSKAEEEKYRPKTIHTYGGQVTVTFEEVGTVVVERTKTETKETLTITDNNGKEVALTDWKKWMKNMDKEYFEAIFSFDQISLQKISRLKGEELSKYLFSSSVIGSDQLYKVEKLIEKEMEALFKKKGKNQKLAKLLTQLNESYEQQKNYKQNLDKYSEQTKQAKMLSSKIEQLEKEIELLIQEVYVKRQLLELKEVIIEVTELENQLKELPYYEVTDEEMMQFQQLTNQLVELERSLDELQVEIGNLQYRSSSLQEKQLSANQLAKLDELIQMSKIYETKLEEISLLVVELKKQEDRMNELTLQEGFRFTEERAVQMNTSSLLKEEIDHAVEENKYVQSSIKQTEVELEQLRISVGKKEEILQELHTNKLLDDEIEKLEKIINTQQVQQQLEGKNDFLLDQLERKQADYKTELKRVKQRKKQQFLISFAMIVFGIIAIVTSVILEQTFFTILGAFLLILGCLVMFYKWRSKWLFQLKTEIEYLEQSVNSYKHNFLSIDDVLQAKRKLDAHQEVMKNYQVELSKMDDLFERIDLLENQLMTWNLKKQQLQLKKEEILEHWQLPNDYSINQLPIIYSLIADYKGLYLQRNKIKEQLTHHQAWVQEIEQQIHTFANLFSLDEQRSALVLLSELTKERKELMNEQSQLSQLTSELEKNKINFTQKQASKEVIVKAINEMLCTKSVERKEQFYQLYEKSKEKKAKQSRLEHLKLTIKSTSIEQKLLDQYIEAPFDKLDLENLDSKISLLKEEKNHLLEEKIKLSNDIRFLEEGKSLETITQDFELVKAECEKTMEQWLELAIAKEKLQETVRFYTEEKLPHILKVASSYFKQLTNDNYIEILFNKQSQFYVRHHSGEFFEISQLSQSTMEQVYISLRMALAKNIFESEHFPLVIDDGFVHFDKKRTANMFDLLRNYSKHQVLLFTCHEHLVHQLKEHHIITVA